MENLAEMASGAGGPVWTGQAVNALVISLVSVAVVSAILTGLGLLLTFRASSPRLGIALQLPLLVLGLAAAILGLTLFALQKPYVFSVPLAGGGALAFVESLVNMLAITVTWRKRQLPASAQKHGGAGM